MGEIYGRAALVIAHTGHHSYSMGPKDPERVSSPAVEAGETDQRVGIEDLRLSDTLFINSNEDEESLIESSEARVEEENMNLADTSQSAISLMNYLSRIWTSDDDYSLMEDKDWEKRKIPDLEGGNEKIWARLFAFWNEDWFYRSWVLQEAVLGKKVILLVDDAACSLDFVMKFWDLAKKRDTPEFLKRGPLADEYSRVLHLSPVSAMKALRDFKHGDGLHDPEQAETRSDLLSLLSLSRTNLASDPRDKVYSLLSLAGKDNIASSITPDYSEENSAAVLYRTIAATHIKAGLGPQLLHYAGIDQKIPGLPSWAPDWSYQSRSNLHPHLYNCSGLSVPSLSLPEAEPHMLRVRDAIIDTINYNGIPWRYYSMDEEQEKFARFREAPDKVFPPFTDEDGRCIIRVMAKRLAADYCPKFDFSEAREAAVARTLVMDCTWRGERTTSDPSFLESWNAFERLYGKGPEEDTPADANIHKSGIFHWIWDFDEEEQSALRKKSGPFEVAFQEAHKGRRFCTTGDGYMCTTPYDTERGDVVVILEGFRTPFVLRKSGDDWRLVGDCYVHDIMDGELVAPLRNCEVRRNEIAINANGEPYALRTSSGFAKFQEFGII
jgi:hypothetical protein